MVDINTLLNFNSKQSSTEDLANKRIDPFKHLSLEKRFYEQTSLITMYYIIASQNFATVAAWYGLVGNANGRSCGRATAS